MFFTMPHPHHCNPIHVHICDNLSNIFLSYIEMVPYPHCADFMEPCVHKSSSSFFILTGTFYSFLKNPSCNPADV
jgi:hypothetical protein